MKMILLIFMIFGSKVILAENRPEMVLKSFSEAPEIPDLLDVTGDCILDDIVYSDGQTFEMNCHAKCICQRGVISCSDNCPSVFWPPEEKCNFIHIPDRCCDEIRCDSDPRMQNCRIPFLNSDNGIGSGMEKIKKYPWVILICENNNCEKTYAGIILSEKHVLTYSPDFQNQKELKFISGKDSLDFSRDVDFQSIEISNVTSHSDFEFGFGLPQLQIIELRDPGFNLDNKNLQAGNLPISKNQCSKFLSPDCAVTTIGWNSEIEFRNNPLSQRARNLYFQEQISTFDPKYCDSNQYLIKRGKVFANLKSKRTCVKGLNRGDCTGPLGGLVVATTEENIHFVVGIMEYRNSDFENASPAEMSTSKIGCSKRGAASVLPLCEYVDWIKSIVNN